ncbi:hypothetical protein HDF16_001605 [Granulicella aggregans]|uniref:Uncharacterized protein n=1 Tax=Granulicella aggregans TaxID=474949 RepID=A0A7W7ZBM0_9BACT|nr:hypothetical protein [Granulicella aggregans]MBB5056920.1 hypothetical protein [Granulicella aggregans]
MSLRYHLITTVHVAKYEGLRKVWGLAGIAQDVDDCLLFVQDKPRTAAQAERLSALQASVRAGRLDNPRRP